jgi:hypothetical protein
MERMIEEGVYLIQPKIDSKGIAFPFVANLFPEKTGEEIHEFLARLVSEATLSQRLLDRVIECPLCRSSSVFSKYNCPRCSSYDIGKASIIEHIRCGYIGSQDKFQKDNQLICPKCKGLVTELDHKKIGSSFECNSCLSRFESPKINHKCQTCENVFTFREAIYEPVFEYSLTEETKKIAAKGSIPLGSIAKALRDKGFEVGVRSDVLGKSGAIHKFDIIARKGTSLIVANFAFEPKEEDIIGLFAKKYDIDPTLTLLIALTSPSKEEEAVSKAYGVRILTSNGTKSVSEEMLDLYEKVS